MSKRQKFLSGLKEAASKASRNRLVTRSATAATTSTPQAEVLRTIDLNAAESPCPAIDDNDYDEFAKQISLTKHDVGAQITPLCIVSQQKADSHDETPFGLPLPQLFDKQFLEHDKREKRDNVFGINTSPGLNGQTTNANSNTSTARLPVKAPIDSCNRYGKSMQPLKRNLFGAEKAICNQDSEFKNRSESNIDKFSLPTSPVASQVPVRPIATEPNDENPLQSVKRNLFAEKTISILDSGCNSGIESDILASSLPTSPAETSKVYKAPIATAFSLNNENHLQDVFVGETASYIQDSGLSAERESSLPSSPTETSQVSQALMPTEFSVNNENPLQATRKDVFVGETASSNNETLSSLQADKPSLFGEERNSDNPSCLQICPSPISSDNFVMSPISYTVDMSTGNILMDLSSDPEQQLEQPAELVLEDFIIETINVEQLETEAPKRKRQFTPPEKPTRKRVKAPQKWKKNVSKESFSKGIEFVNPKGVLKRARKLQRGCDLSCRNKCTDKLLQPAREEIFKTFWSIPSQVEKWGFISRLIKTVPVQNSILETPKKKHMRQYQFRVKGDDIKVCKTMFLDTLDICDSWVETALDKVEKGGTISPDRRGKELTKPGPSPKTEALNQTVRDHIATLKRMPSHYSRANSSREYLTEEFKSVADMYEIYKGWMDEQHPTHGVATLRQYRDVFNFEYNLDFFIPMKDLCDVCVTYENTPAEQVTPAMENAHLEHTRTKDLLYLMKKADMDRAKLKTSTTLCVADMDYQKSLNSPKCFTSVFYYKRKLSVNNFTIVDTGRDEDCCYVYDETTAKKGSKEVCSFLNHFITRKVESGVTEIIVYCDNCSGQNKNRNVVAFLVFISAKFNIKVTVKYLEKGHTYNAADTVHSLIERKSRPHQLYSPEQWYEVIGNSKRSKTHPMVVERVHQDMIFDWNDLADKLNLDKNVNGQAIPWTKVREFRFDGATPHEFQYKVKYEDEPTTVSTKTVGRPVNFTTYELKKLYSGRLPISQAKLKDLLYYCNHNYIPVIHQEFYRGLEASENVPDNVVADPEVDLAQGRARVRRPVAKRKSQKNTAAPAPGTGTGSARLSRRKRMQPAKKRKTNQEVSEENSESDDADEL